MVFSGKTDLSDARGQGRETDSRAAAKKVGGDIILRAISLGALTLAITGCASVKLSMPSMPSGDRDRQETVRKQEREALGQALARLEQSPSRPVARDEGGFVGLLFGASAPTPREQARDYINAMEADAPSVTATVRRDVEESLVAVWRVAHTGRDATTALKPVASDLVMVESAIVEARRCRLFYTAALGILSKEVGTVERSEIRRVKDQFNEAILELGRTADMLHARLQEEPATTFAENNASF